MGQKVLKLFDGWSESIDLIRIINIKESSIHQIAINSKK